MNLEHPKENGFRETINLRRKYRHAWNPKISSDFFDHKSNRIKLIRHIRSQATNQQEFDMANKEINELGL
jgi:hypothetical protein